MPKIPNLPGCRTTLVYDTESFSNFWCIAFSDGDRVKVFDFGDVDAVRHLVSDPTLGLIGFNNFDYDDPILAGIVEGSLTTVEAVNGMSHMLIADRDALSEEDDQERFQSRYKKRPWNYSADVLRILNKKGSLKEHGCQTCQPTIEETPHDFNAPLPWDKVDAVKHYCGIDALNTANVLMSPNSVLLGETPWQRILLREQLDRQFGIGKRIYCLSEAGIAQAVFLTLHRNRTGEYSSAVRERAETNPVNLARAHPLSTIIAENVAFNGHVLGDVLGDLRAAQAVSGDMYGRRWKLDIPEAQTLVSFCGAYYQLGVGGLHSVDPPGRFEATDEHRLVDLDVTSYYPSIMINLGLYPAQLGETFVEDMKNIRDMRVAAKRAGDKGTADALKIVVNSTFGKLNDIYSPLRSVPDALRVTINGQLYLLMLIEMMEQVGISVISANTDGITVKLRNRQNDLEVFANLVKEWQDITGFELELNDYTRIARISVNEYVAIYKNGKVKTKGVFENPKRTGKVIVKAAVDWLTKRIPLEQTIAETWKTSPRDFLIYQRSGRTGQLELDDKPIGRLARWVMVDSGGRLCNRTPKQHAKVEYGDSVELTENSNTIPMPDFDAYRRAADHLVCKTLPKPAPIFNHRIRRMAS